MPITEKQKYKDIMNSSQIFDNIIVKCQFYDGIIENISNGYESAHFLPTSLFFGMSGFSVSGLLVGT